MSRSRAASHDQSAVDFWKLFQDLPDSYLLFRANDPVYTIVDLNKERERLTGIRRDLAIGKPLFEIYPDTSDEYKKKGISRVHESLKMAIATGKPQRIQALRYDMKGDGGALVERYWQSNYIPISFEESSEHYILAATRDITSELLTEKRAATTEQQLESALSIGKVGSWVWDITADSVIADSNLSRMFGIKRQVAARGLPLQAFLHAIHSDDRDRVDQAIQQAIQQQGDFEEEYRTYTTTGKMRWVLARGKVQKRDGTLLFPGVIVDITERRELQAEIILAREQDKLNRQAAKVLQERNDELEALSRTKDEFVALASHQLRTPATAVKQYIGMVLQGYVGDITDIQTEMLEKAFESNERQIQIINQILNAARVDTGRLIMAPVMIDLRNLVEGIAADMQASFEQRKQTFKVAAPKLRVPVMADLGYLRMAIENLIHNASIYTPEGGTIAVELTCNERTCTLRVNDTGVGIKKADLSKLFAKFSRIHNPLSVAAGGSGIGLYLAAEIVRLHHGTVTVESKINHGSTFAISLPLVLNNKQIRGKAQG